MSFKLQVRLFSSWLGSVILLAFSSSSQADQLALADSPLFLGTQIDPNVFFMMDDSGSMDWEILTIDYHPFDDYWKTHSKSGSSSSNYPTGLRDDGNLRTRSSVGVCTGTNTYYYIFENDDNTYSSRCSREAIELQSESFDNDWRVGSSDFNIMYYNPAVNYSPWIGYTDASFSSARSNPDNDTDGYTELRDLEGFRYTVWEDDHGVDLDENDEVNGPDKANDTPNGIVDLWDSFVEYTINDTQIIREERNVPAAGSGFTMGDCDDGDVDDDPPYANCFGTTKTVTTISGASLNQWGRTVTQEQLNVANWYQYARKRSFVSKGAVALVVTSNPSFRFGYGQINDWGTVFVEVPDIALDDYEAHNTALIDEMASWEWEGQGTPLRRGLEVAGRYYDDYYGWQQDPFVSECQQAYTVLFTDGYWGGSSPYTSAIGDKDGDGQSDTLADVAHYFYTEDLSGLDDEVPTTPIDPADHQHMVTFTVAFGVEGNLVDTDDDGYPNPELAEDDAWYNGYPNTNPEKIDDLWHAAFNSKAYFVSAQSPNEVAQAIGEALLEIADRVGSAASVATNTGSLNAGSKLFQARFDSSDWKGQLLAYNINLDGTIDANPTWDAGDEINDQHYDTGREIITFNPDIDNPVGGDVEGAGIPFRFPADYNSTTTSEMNTSQVTDLMANAPYALSTADAGEISANQIYGTDIVNYFRGDESNELTGQNFRLRNSVLGDIVNSDPNFVDVPNFRYEDAMEVKSYADFVTDHTSRQGVVYVGANDGMLHGFNSDTGAEMIAYVPTPVYENMAELATGDYIHRYYVDGGPNIIDVFLPNMDDPESATNGLWRTVLAGGLNGGGQGIYALDVTNPSAFDEANANDIVLWEFTDADDADLGYTFGKVQMAKMNDGSWAAVFGNGYNNSEADGTASTTGHAVLYIVDVETGDLIKKIDTEVGSTGSPNGLATPLLIDEDADQIADYIYAGDWEGNLWKFDVSSNNTANWDVAWESSGTPQPLFSTLTNQQITSQPQATFHPDNLEGFMVFFGTGAYLEEDDNLGTGQATQTFYGIWDKNTSATPSISRANLRSQAIDNQYDQQFDTNDDGVNDTTFTLRDVSDNAIDWGTHLGWYLDLIPTQIEGSANSNNYGERQVSNAIVRNGRVIFTTLVPSEVECEFGGTSFLMELDFRDGGALEFPAFDLNGDGEYDADDTLAAGRASDVGIMPTVSILADDAQDVAFGSGASGDIDVIQISVGDQSYGRQSWRQLE